LIIESEATYFVKQLKKKSGLQEIGKRLFQSEYEELSAVPQTRFQSKSSVSVDKERSEDDGEEECSFLEVSANVAKDLEEEEKEEQVKRDRQDEGEGEENVDNEVDGFPPQKRRRMNSTSPDGIIDLIE
jgi:hypothetical protein